MAANPVVHGQTCNNPTIFLPGEDPEEYAAQVDRWSVTLGADTEPEIAQVGLAVYQLWKIRRTRTATAAAVTDKTEAIENDFDDRTADEVRTLIPQLPIDPKGVVYHLRKSVCGCAFLLGQLRLLRDRLTTHHSFEVSERRHALRVLGHKPSDLFTDPFVYELDRLYLGAISGPGSFTPEGAANAFLLDYPGDMSDREFAARLEPMVNNLPTIAEGHGRLIEIIEQAIEELTERIELLGLRDERQKSLAVLKAQDDGSPEGDKRERHETMAVRLHHASMREFRAMREARRKYGSGEPDRLPASNDGESPKATEEAPADADCGEDATFAERRATLGGGEVPAGSGHEAPVQGPPAGEEVFAQSRATVPQVSEGDARCGEAPAKSEPLRPPAPPSGLAQTLAEVDAFLRRKGYDRFLE